MQKLGIGIVGGGYMGKAHAVAMRAVASVFDCPLRPVLERVCATTVQSASNYKKAYGFNTMTTDWRVLVNDPKVEAIIIASPQKTHREIAEAALSLGKPVFCEKPLGASLADAEALVACAKRTGAVNMVGFNYIRTPASQYARKLIESGALGEIYWFRGEHTEDFLADPAIPASWRTQGLANGVMGDLAPHMVNAALALMGPIAEVCARRSTVHKSRPLDGGEQEVSNDDQLQFMCRFTNGADGHLFFSRVATGRKMGYAYEITGTKGAIRFDQEDQNALWLYKAEGPEVERGFRKILTGPAHPDYGAFCQGPGHGTGYQDQIIIEARDFLQAIHSGISLWPTFADGLEVSQVLAAAEQSHASGRWQPVFPE
ncbi:Gfo/Idh/MocA family protein [Polycladidibacter hongkongensis]|uniref:Gfo/Idh/MocA family protein n=1 Tax=Polycladidibacter hongkongensis TaxID=1647556 RepID=UPI00082CA6AB|nr:Gfo/Idh/MocA family oxidoreductase [Pseudovibrio hongkongensis]